MNSSEQLSVYTVPSTWKRVMYKPLANPYERVVGVRNEDRERLWTPRVAEGDEDGRYSRSDAAERVIASSRVFTERLVGFFATYLARLSEGSDTEFNCHRFGWWMKGSLAAAKPGALDAPDALILEGFRTSQNLALGQRGAIGICFRGYPGASHSVVGLGQNVAECVQVMAADGYMGITSYQDILDHYAPHTTPDNVINPESADYGLYV